MSNSHSGLCCFKNLRPVYLSISLLIANAVAVIFLIWGVAEMVWTKKYARALYWVGFIILIITLILAIIILIITIIRKEQNLETTRSIGNILCISTMVLVLVGEIFTLIGAIITISDYAKFTNEVNFFIGIYDNSTKFHLPGKWWATLIVPEVITLIASDTAFLCARALYIIFNEKILTSITDNEQKVRNAKIAIDNITIINPGPNHNNNNYTDTVLNLNNNQTSNQNNGLFTNPNNMNNDKETYK